ncbi:hypothetical protein BaRGS_00015207 [Batillaria attramentaria]|uniref:Uncharacterized protein n=1 Tax=Batillaria attramentaria TaxID=370345 RepID=A0ABD0J9G5_9CAEN
MLSAGERSFRTRRSKICFAQLERVESMNHLVSRRSMGCLELWTAKVHMRALFLKTEVSQGDPNQGLSCFFLVTVTFQ